MQKFAKWVIVLLQNSWVNYQFQGFHKILCVLCPNGQFQTVAVSSNNVQYRLLAARRKTMSKTPNTKDNLGEKVIGNIFHNVNDDDEYNVKNANDVNTCELVLCEQAF